eukprot:Lankesteria_metandrocarpae@DN2173_c0_g1_i1.p1
MAAPRSIELNEGGFMNFDEFVKVHETTLVEFYAPWCGHCKSLTPHYEEAAKKLKELGGVKLGKVDSTVETELAKRYDIRGYPTLKLFRKGEPMDYTGGRTGDTIVAWIESVTGPPVTYITEDEAKAKDREILFVARLKSKDNDAAKLYEKVADEMRLSAKFSAIISSGAKEDVTVYRDKEESSSFEIGKDVEALKEWILAEKIPLFGPIDGENYAAYEVREQELVWFAAGEEDFAKHASAFRAAAAKFRADYSFVWLDSNRFGNHAREGLGLEELPGVVLRLREGGRYVFPSDQKYEAEALISFFTDIKSGKIEKSLKSEPVPEKNDEAVKVVVGSTFNELVFRDDADTLLEVYAPWCGECRNVEPVYKEFAEKVASNKNIVVLKMDGSANEVDTSEYEFDRFPTLFFTKAGEKKPVQRSGGFDLDALTAFIKENASKPFELEEATSDKDEL